ncbi:MAG TPA: flagellar basal-body rod protein FlgF [Phycisphaerae bacterium]|nr:flagellar basal-body rod protein FlgF [Phycisphaerae bacterium]HRR87212.1 flagellar basal-body rod protein FlgF [Phycisphaerae bacterium]
MVYGIYQSAAGMIVNQYRQAVLANNLANLDTVGFKHDLTIVRERKVETAEDALSGRLSDRILDRMTGGSLVAPTVTSFRQGEIQVTGRETDVAIEGNGFFAVSDGAKTRYTRDGRFSINNEGLLVTAGGRPVLDDRGKTISVPETARGRIRIGEDGTVRSGDEAFARIGLVDFADRSRLCKVGANMFEAVGTRAEAVSPRLRTNSLESSTVDPTKAMVAMIEVSRAYEINANLVSMADTTLSRAVNDIGRIQ